ncbi:hypothetical protein [Sphingopyxis panaciterrulae]|uniref:Maleate isomerase n=1 Tax=Sphingopyxis panaciterrulae TaxID=462372 RepID=A0A7W9B6S0_9SPHN|nr:hypothetical protein [Sphingopyxis panaciterrulae]MBB5707047.1 maleate isomerase [Sphingopyxis panaciterrulae]
MSACYDYGRAGIIGIGTPQANPTVEAEMRILLPQNALLQTTRLASSAPESLDRLREYLWSLPDALARYDTLRPTVFGFGCTGSSYLMPPGFQAAMLTSLEARFGYPIVTATDAIAWHLRALGARRIALASPYRGALAEAALAFWQAEGFEVAEVREIETAIADTRGIYALGSTDAGRVTAPLSALPVDAILLSGTGMPSLRLIADAHGRSGPPLVSSNYCLAMRLCDVANISAPTVEDWGPRLAAATALPTGPSQ